MQKIKVIAEIANAHQGDIGILHSLVKAAAGSGADAVKFQWFKYDRLATEDYSFYKSYQEMFITESEWEKTLCLARSLGLEIWVDIFDDWGLELAHQFVSEINGVKIPSTVIQSDNIVKGVFLLKKSVLLGVGGWYEQELDQFISGLDKKYLTKLILMHGFQGYPTKTEHANLIRIHHLKKHYGLKAGFADHEDASKQLAIDLPVYALFAGADLIEKHITLDRSKKGYDYYSSLEPPEFSSMVSKLREAETAIGTIDISETERNYLKDTLRVVARNNIEKGEILTSDKIINKRCPVEKALMPLKLKEKLPGVASKKIQKNQPITLEAIEKPKITIGVICRLKSTRLAKKALLPINGVSSIERCLLNCLAVPNVSQVVLATSCLMEDDTLEQCTMDGRVKVIRGDPDNVAVRLTRVAYETGANIILRVTGDCPAVSPEILDILIQNHLQSGRDLTIPTSDGYAIGTAGDVYTVESLERLLKQNKPLMYTEYLSFYYTNNPVFFSVNAIELPAEFRYPQWRLTLDEQKDLELFEKIYSDLNIQKEPLYFSKLRDYLLDNPLVAKINANVPLKWKDDTRFVEEMKKATILEK